MPPATALLSLVSPRPLTPGPAVSPPPLEPQEAFLELGRIRFDSTDLDGVLLRVAELAKRTVPETSDVSVTLVRGDRAFTAAFTGEDALRLDESQYAPGHGPCLDVAQSSGAVTIDDMSTELRWPEFALRAVECGVHSSLSVALPVQESMVGALNLYSRIPRCFDPDAVELARTFAGYAAVAIANAHLYESNATLAENMRKAMDTRSVIEQAKGVLMALHGCTPSQAFEMLSVQSQQTNNKLNVIARDIVANIQRSDT
jgi:GAF domain-containing protein